MNAFVTIISMGMGLISIGWSSVPAASTAADIRLRVDPEHPIRMIPEDFCGLSYESKLLLPDGNGRHYFSGDNRELIAVFRQLGIKSLRVGGNTAERASVAIPDEGDIDHLFAFARAAGVKVIYTVRMEGNTPGEAARIAKYVADNYSENLDCLIIGNEPDKGSSYETYYATWRSFAEEIGSPGRVPGAQYCAPTATRGAPEFSALMAKDEAGSGRLAMIGQHYYPGGSSKDINGIPEVALAGMMSLDWHERYQEFHDEFVLSVLEAGFSYRLNETNSFSSGGVLGASDTFAAAIWGIDYLYWWAEHSAAGINFHSGEKVYPGDQVIRKNVYTPLTTTWDGVQVLPLGYAIKAFTLAAHGRTLVPVEMETGEGVAHVAAYAVMDPLDGSVLLTLINGQFGEYGSKYTVTVSLPGAIASMHWMTLRGKAGKVASVEGLTLGGSPIGTDGEWAGEWSAFDITGGDNSANLVLFPETVMLVKLQYQNN